MFSDPGRGVLVVWLPPAVGGDRDPGESGETPEGPRGPQVHGGEAVACAKRVLGAGKNGEKKRQVGVHLLRGFLSFLDIVAFFVFRTLNRCIQLAQKIKPDGDHRQFGNMFSPFFEHTGSF